MDSLEHRIAVLRGRTTLRAWQRLEQLREHQNFSVLIEELENRTGTIDDPHIEQFLRALAGPSPSAGNT